MVDGLILPNGIAFDDNGDLLVVTNAVSGGEPNGQLLRCEGVAEVADAAGSDVTITIDEMTYAPSDITIHSDEDMTLHFVNNGVAAHNVTIDALGMRGEMLTSGEEIEIVVNLPEGNYGFGCDVSGHHFAGMTGVIHAVS